jgi:hypothetical protein
MLNRLEAIVVTRKKNSYTQETVKPVRTVGTTLRGPDIIINETVKFEAHEQALAIDQLKRRAEMTAWDALQSQLEKGEDAPPSLIEMVLKPKHFPNVKVSLTGKLENMRGLELVQHMDSLLDS